MDETKQETTEKNMQGLLTFLAYFNNSPTQISKYFKISVPTVSAWKARGRISRQMAERIDADEALPFSKDQLRFDIRVW